MTAWDGWASFWCDWRAGPHADVDVVRPAAIGGLGVLHQPQTDRPVEELLGPPLETASDDSAHAGSLAAQQPRQRSWRMESGRRFVNCQPQPRPKQPRSLAAFSLCVTNPTPWERIRGKAASGSTPLSKATIEAVLLARDHPESPSAATQRSRRRATAQADARGWSG